MELFIAIDPAELPTAQQKGVVIRCGRPIFYEKAKVKKARDILVDALINVAQKREKQTAYAVAIVYVYRNKSLSKQDFGKPKTTRPDVDNLTKLVLDAITDSHIAWEDDGAVSTLVLRKRNAGQDEEAHIYINIQADEDFPL